MGSVFKVQDVDNRRHEIVKMKIRRNGLRVLPPFHLGPLHQLTVVIKLPVATGCFYLKRFLLSSVRLFLPFAVISCFVTPIPKFSMPSKRFHYHAPEGHPAPRNDRIKPPLRSLLSFRTST
jgi:hypothetical protein